MSDIEREKTNINKKLVWGVDESIVIITVNKLKTRGNINPAKDEITNNFLSCFIHIPINNIRNPRLKKSIDTPWTAENYVYSSSLNSPK